ncbi:nucleotidyltransferase domain-containing protein [Thiocapsa sp.]|uniref:nucleotidyltransferase domain-containing protein n=1 Tax=Thiocapsa sp. TaxID=2024551 RepID=UPI0025FA72E1|nr:nucleotidyltransferase domain-containing protein [Thiocapsa sp.]
MDIAEEILLGRMVSVIVREVDPDAIILVGSRARGEGRWDSDVDLLVVERKPFSDTHSRGREAGRLYRSLAGFGVAKDLLLYSRDEVDRLSKSPGHVVSKALKEGKVIYGKPSG